MHPIIEYLSKYIKLSDDQAEAIITGSKIQEFKRKEIILRPGEVARNCYFILKGCLKTYYLVDGEEKVTGLFTEGEPLVPVSYATGEKSDYFVEAIEPCITSLGSNIKTEELFDRIPEMKNVSLVIGGEIMARNQVSYDTFRTLPPEQRYQKLRETRPDLCNRIPQYTLASYLGVKPESLSRIRKRMQEKAV